MPGSPLRTAPLLGAVFLLACAATLASCAARQSMPRAPAAQGAGTGRSVRSARGRPAQASKIVHIIVIVQENRSFDDLFYGYPGANTATSGKNSKGETIPLQPVGLESEYGIEHNSSDFFAACDGTGSVPGTNCRMDGFDKEQTYGSGVHPNPEYGYVPHRETKLYFDMAKQYVLGDDMFTSHIDASFVSHQYIVAGQAAGAVDLPTDAWGCGGGPSDSVLTLNQDRTYGSSEAPCFGYETIADELDASGLPWRYYSSPPSNVAYIWSAYQAVSQIYNGPDWLSDVITPQSKILSDIPNGELAAVTWVTPTCRNSDHATCGGKTGPDWVASIVNAVGESSFWDSSAIFVMWDEWGGWYDHVPPPYEDYDGLGIRVPLLVISPYAKDGYVSHVQYEHGSILRFIEDTFGLARLSASDSRANSPADDCFDFTKQPRAFQPLPTTLPPRYFIRQPPDPRPPDED